jgi:hypothetical protein
MRLLLAPFLLAVTCLTPSGLGAVISAHESPALPAGGPGRVVLVLRGGNTYHIASRPKG